MNAALAQELMDQFADRTGVTGKFPPRRYLWTDAHAVCNFLSLAQYTGDELYQNFAHETVQQVHHVLGRHHPDDPRQGWISGLPDAQAEQHPTRGGLRIGKALPERRLDEPPDSQREWDRDGQYFHYLTKWMHALYQLSRESHDSRYARWAAELAVTAHRAFSYRWHPRHPKRMYWKMSVDLSRAQVPAMGQHDPLDGLISCLELLTAQELKGEIIENLDTLRFEYLEMLAGASLSTTDPLGIGGLLENAARLAQLIADHGLDRRKLLDDMLLDAEMSLHQFCRSPLLNQPPANRLAFRELGLAIGLRGIPKIRAQMARDLELGAVSERLMQFVPLAEQIESFWSDPAQQDSRSWCEHLDINAVMLATSLISEEALACDGRRAHLPATP